MEYKYIISIQNIDIILNNYRYIVDKYKNLTALLHIDFTIYMMQCIKKND